MKNQAIFLFLFLLISYEGRALSINYLDSVGVSVKNGQKYIIHQVEAGETLYALSRKYDVNVQLIKQANDESVSNLSIGQNVLIPLNQQPDSDEAILHTVSTSETLYSISRLYSVKVDDLKQWNNLDENSISVGQKLVIKKDANVSEDQLEAVSTGSSKTHTVQQSETLYSISRMFEVTTDQLKEWNRLSSNSLSVGQVLIVSVASSNSNEESGSNSSMLPIAAEQASTNNTQEAGEVLKTDPAVVSVNVIPDMPDEDIIDNLDEDIIEKPVDKIVEKGMAEVIESTSETKKYLALHRKAPIGTIMQVKNEMNGQSVFVRIVGSIQDTGDNSKVMLMISKKAYDRLGAIDRRFPVQISYIP